LKYAVDEVNVQVETGQAMLILPKGSIITSRVPDTAREEEVHVEVGVPVMEVGEKEKDKLGMDLLKKAE
jgi:hypothetical protein